MSLNSTPEILRNSIYGNHTHIQLPGVRVHYVECGMKNKELLLFVHGFPDFWFSWKDQIKFFSKDHWVVAVDMRGYGESERSQKVSFYKLDLLINDIRNLIFALGREKFTLIAHDWGGVIGHYFLRIHPEMLNKYILINTVHLPKLKESIFTDIRQFFKSWYILLMQIPYVPEYFFTYKNFKNIKSLFQESLTEEELNAYTFTFGSFEKIRGPINYYRANFRTSRKFSEPTVEKLNMRKVPGLYIHGDNDVALTLNTCFNKSFERVKNVQCISIPNAGHFVHIHRSREINGIIRKFLNSTKLAVE